MLIEISLSLCAYKKFREEYAGCICKFCFRWKWRHKWWGCYSTCVLGYEDTFDKLSDEVPVVSTDERSHALIRTIPLPTATIGSGLCSLCSQLLFFCANLTSFWLLSQGRSFTQKFYMYIVEVTEPNLRAAHRQRSHHRHDQALPYSYDWPYTDPNQDCLSTTISPWHPRTSS